MQYIETTADVLVSRLQNLARAHNITILDSCAVGSGDGNLLIAAIDPVEVCEISNRDPSETLQIFDDAISRDLAAIFTVSYDFGLRLQNISPHRRSISQEPDVYISLFDSLIVHDYEKGETFLSGDRAKCSQLAKALKGSPSEGVRRGPRQPSQACSNFGKSAYLDAIRKIQELIRSGDTYQTNLTQQFQVELMNDLTPIGVFSNIRQNHPAPFAAYIDRISSTVVSASPEGFIRVSPGQNGRRIVSASPVKGTARRGNSLEEDALLRDQLIHSEKNRAENTMIVDLMRNDLGQICDYGSVTVGSLCELDEHPTLFHLVSTVNGVLRDEIQYSDIIKAVFPSGSITGAPKFSTMQIINSLEPTNRGLSMGAIGFSIPGQPFGLEPSFEMSVAIRTMVIRENTAVFNVGGGIVIDSDPESEYAESLLKAKALLSALSAIRISNEQMSPMHPKSPTEIS